MYGVATARPEGTGFAVPIVAGARPAESATPTDESEAPSGGLASRLGQLDHHAVADGQAAIHLRGDVEVVRGDDGGKPGGAHQLAERREHPFGGAHVEIAGWLVGKENARSD